MVESPFTPWYSQTMVLETRVNIESMAFKGYGVARIDGKVLFIPYSVTGDKAWIKIAEKKKNYSIGKLIQLIEPSSWRVNPPCPYFSVCGGCQWQHIHNSIQVDLRKEILRKTLQRIGGLKGIPPITGTLSPQPYGYRARVQLKVIGKAVGYYEERSHRVVDIDCCLIAHPLINQLISHLRKSLPFFFRMGEIEINVSPEEQKGILIFHPSSSRKGMKHFLEEFLQTHSILKGIAVVEKKGLTFFGDPSLNLTISLNDLGDKGVLKLQSSPQSFFQVNLDQNRTLIQTVLSLSEVNEDERVLDLYAGIGNFSLPLATASKEVWGIEENQVAVKDARLNAKRNGIENCDFIADRVEVILRGWRRGNPDLIVLDPPRTGCKRILGQVADLKPNRIVYVSCEPATFSRDLGLFSEAGYSLQKLALVDMFPQTYHTEVVGLLKPNERVQGI